MKQKVSINEKGKVKVIHRQVLGIQANHNNPRLFWGYIRYKGKDTQVYRTKQGNWIGNTENTLAKNHQQNATNLLRT